MEKKLILKDMQMRKLIAAVQERDRAIMMANVVAENILASFNLPGGNIYEIDAVKKTIYVRLNDAQPKTDAPEMVLEEAGREGNQAGSPADRTEPAAIDSNTDSQYAS